MMKKSHLIAIFFLGIIIFSTSLAGVMAADEWGVEEDKKLYYWLDMKEADTDGTKIIAQGMVTITVENIDSPTLDITLTIETSFKGEQAIDFRDDIEVEDTVYTGTAVNIAHVVDSFNLAVSVLLTLETLDSAATIWDGILDFIEAIVSLDENMTMTRDMTETSFKYNVLDSETEEEWDCVAKYSDTGILQSLKWYRIDVDGMKTSFTFEKKLIPLNFPDLYFYIGGGVVVVVLLIVVIACCARKKRR